MNKKTLTKKKFGPIFSADHYDHAKIKNYAIKKIRTRIFNKKKNIII